MRNRTSVKDLAATVMRELDEYRDLATDAMKEAVKDAGKTVRNEIRNSEATPKKSGDYRKSWTSRTTAESSKDIEVTVYSPSRYMLAHLLENGHAKRNGGRTRAFPHIAPAEEIGERQPESDIRKALTG